MNSQENLNFDDLCDRISGASKEQHHDLSWSFLYTPRSTLHSKQKILFLGLNPGGGDGVAYKEDPSSEEGNDYLCGNWEDGWPKTKSPLQLQVQLLYRMIANSMGESISYEKLMNESLAANYVPFRSPNWTALQNKGETLKFVRDLWADIFSYMRPRVIICMGHIPFEEVIGILKAQEFSVVNRRKEKIGWGAANSEFAELHNGRETIVMARFPHLSRYKVFSSDACERELKFLCARIAKAL